MGGDGRADLNALIGPQDADFSGISDIRRLDKTPGSVRALDRSR